MILYLVLIKPSDIPEIFKKFNTFDKNIQFTIDTFPDNVIHFLDILISLDKTDVYHKSTHTGQHTHFSSFEPFFVKLRGLNLYFTVRQNYVAPVNYLKTKFAN